MASDLSNYTYIREDNSGTETIYEFINLCNSETQTELNTSSVSNSTSESSTQTDTKNTAENNSASNNDSNSILKLVGNRNIAVSGFIQIGNAVALDDKTNCAITGLLQLNNTSSPPDSKDDCGLTGLLHIGNPGDVGSNDSVAGLIQIGNHSFTSNRKTSKTDTAFKMEKSSASEKKENSDGLKSSISCQTDAATATSASEVTNRSAAPKELVSKSFGVKEATEEKWITKLGEEGLILTRADESSPETGTGSEQCSYENLLKNTTTSVISVGEGENAESYIVIKAKDISAAGNINTEKVSLSENISDIIFDRPSTSQQSFGGPTEIVSLQSDVDGNRVYVHESMEVDHSHVTLQETAGHQSGVDNSVFTELNRRGGNLLHLDQYYDNSDGESNSAIESLITPENSQESDDRYIDESSIISSESDNISIGSSDQSDRLAQAHKYLNDYAHKLKEFKEKSVEKSITVENVMTQKPGARRITERTASECEKVEAVEGLMQMSKSGARASSYQNNARKQLDDAIKSGMKNFPGDMETFTAVETLMKIGTTPPKDVVNTQTPDDNLENENRQDQDNTATSAEHNAFISIKNLPYTIYRCVNCEQTFLNEGEVVAVSRSADFRRLYMCHDCHKSKKDGFLHKCRLCGAGFQAIRSLEQHFENHELKYIYRCEYCGKGFGYHGRNRYLAHERTHKGPNPCFCSVCGMQFSRAQYLEMHLDKTHTRKKMHFCEICAQFFKEHDQLRTHYRSQHFCYDTISREASDYRCGICGEVYPSLYMLNTHLVLHTRLSKGFDDMYMCLVCRKSFKNVRNLQKHHERCHPQKIINNCPVCEKIFKSYHARNAHMAVHQKELFEKEQLELEQKRKLEQDEVKLIEEGEGEPIDGVQLAENTATDDVEIENENRPSTEVVLGTGTNEAEPTILVEMKTPRPKIDISNTVGKMKSLLTPASIEMLKKAQAVSNTSKGDVSLNKTSENSDKDIVISPLKLAENQEFDQTAQNRDSNQSARTENTESQVQLTQVTLNQSPHQKEKDGVGKDLKNSKAKSQVNFDDFVVPSSSTSSKNPRLVEHNNREQIEHSESFKFPKIKFQKPNAGPNKRKKKLDPKKTQLSSETYASKVGEVIGKIVESQKVYNEIDQTAVDNGNKKELQEINSEQREKLASSPVQKLPSKGASLQEKAHVSVEVGKGDNSVKSSISNIETKKDGIHISDTSFSKKFPTLKEVTVTVRDIVNKDSAKIESGNLSKVNIEKNENMGQSLNDTKDETLNSKRNVKDVSKEMDSETTEIEIANKESIIDTSAGSRKSNRKKIHSRKFLEAIDDESVSKKKAHVSISVEKPVLDKECSVVLQETSTGQEKPENANGNSQEIGDSGVLTSTQTDVQEVETDKEKRDKDFQKEFLKYSKTALADTKKPHTGSSSSSNVGIEKSMLDKECSVVLHDIGNDIRNMKSSDNFDSDSQGFSEQMSSMSTWSSKFQEFIGKSSLPGNKRSSETDIGNIDTTTKKVLKK